MKKTFLSFSLILALAAASLQPLFAADPIIIGLSKFKKEDRDVKDFKIVAAGGPINVVITLGNTESLRFEGDAEAISTLITEVISNKLIIRPKNSWTSWAKKYEGKQITAYVTAKTLQALIMSGNGKMSVTNEIKSNSLSATLSGSGSITANIEVNNFVGTISGSGNLNISGEADKASVTVSGSGSLTKKSFTVGTMTSAISGSGSIYVTAEDKINAVISGSGSINYSGNPEVEQRVIGSGRIRKI
ncbi:MAG: DUF2807 domain-containing protein [Pedobacter sp.]|nr:MAG: DUF2807 domain-containing protein [Pedobacter sp.]